MWFSGLTTSASVSAERREVKTSSHLIRPCIHPSLLSSYSRPPVGGNGDNVGGSALNQSRLAPAAVSPSSSAFMSHFGISFETIISPSLRPWEIVLMDSALQSASSGLQIKRMWLRAWLPWLLLARAQLRPRGSGGGCRQTPAGQERGIAATWRRFAHVPRPPRAAR